MDARDRFLEAYLAADKAERELWLQVKGTRPGDPGYSSELWKRWAEAAERTDAAWHALREAHTASKPGDLS